ncbi:transcription factor MYB105-like [Rhodamnia argentea]|uniref:Transcription factor MYB105-like n=1 Tax=Rhodamnia argentea TaxID=178133 RepID=A0ABM3HW06_9MYRT|nr:transcription factor MYB105-like [Rhodamnia argentea]
MDPRINGRTFCEEEEYRLLATRKVYGKKWAMIARLFSEQTDNVVKNHSEVGKSCKFRWFNQLDSQINRRAFSEGEEERLLAPHKVCRNKWAMITLLFPGWTDNVTKNHRELGYASYI